MTLEQHNLLISTAKAQLAMLEVMTTLLLTIGPQNADIINAAARKLGHGIGGLEYDLQRIERTRPPR
jgi:hypothetical protein